MISKKELTEFVVIVAIILFLLAIFNLYIPKGASLEVFDTLGYVDNQGLYHITGKIKNTGKVILRSIQIIVRVHYIDSDYDYDEKVYILNLLKPGEITSFIIAPRIVGGLGGWDVGRFEVKIKNYGVYIPP